MFAPLVAACLAPGTPTPCNPTDNMVAQCSTLWEDMGPGTYVDRPDAMSLNISSAGAIQNVVEGSNADWFVASAKNSLQQHQQHQLQLQHHHQQQQQQDQEL
jgi:hypothetical protein